MSSINDKKQKEAFMNHDILKEVIFDQHEIIKKTKIVPRDYDFDLNANYVLIGLRRAGKSTLLYKIVKDLVEKGIAKERILLEDKSTTTFENFEFGTEIIRNHAKKELDKFSPYSFVAKEEKEGKKVIGWTLFPVFFEDREDPALQEKARMAKVTARLQLENNVYDYLKFSFDFKSDEINKNKKTLIEGQNRIPDFMGFLGELKKGARLAENPKGYVIGAIKRKLKEL